MYFTHFAVTRNNIYIWYQIPESECHYYVDFEFTGQKEKRFSQDPRWQTLISFPFLDKEHSHPFFRAFYVPYFSDRYTVKGSYHLFKNVALIPAS